MENDHWRDVSERLKRAGILFVLTGYGDERLHPRTRPPL